MIFHELSLKGALLLSAEKIEDERGFFTRVFGRQEFIDRGLNPHLEQASIAYNRKKATLRGMHYQIEPFAETKLVRCIKGSIYDVIVDLRSPSPTYRQWLAIELKAGYQMLYIPEGFAHGYVTLEDDTELFYQISSLFKPEYSRGIRWNDPALNIRWPLRPEVISKKDQEYPLL